MQEDINDWLLLIGIRRLETRPKEDKRVETLQVVSAPLIEQIFCVNVSHFCAWAFAI